MARHAISLTSCSCGVGCPPVIEHRYTTETVPWGCSPASRLAEEHADERVDGGLDARFLGELAHDRLLG